MSISKRINSCLLLLALIGVVCDGSAVEPEHSTATAAAVPATWQFLRLVLTHHFATRASEFSRTAPVMSEAVKKLCQAPSGQTLNEARLAWIDTMLAWEALDAIELGPLLERRSIYKIDFWPTRYREVENVARSPPSTVALLDRINAPAKGLPALEWLLWSEPQTPPVMAANSNCTYAHLLAQGVVEEATQLDHAFQLLAARDLTDAIAKELFSSLINQTFGGIELLRGKHMLKPATLNQGKYFPRVVSGQTANAWRARWTSIQELLVGNRVDPDASLNAYLGSLESPSIAEKLSAAAQHASTVLQQISLATPPAAEAASKALASVETIFANDVAPALHVTIGFHSYDGD